MALLTEAAASAPPTDELEEKLARVMVILDDLLERGGEVSDFARQLAASLVPGPEGAVDVEALFRAGKPLMVLMNGFERKLVAVPAGIAHLTSSIIDRRTEPGKALLLEMGLIIDEVDITFGHVVRYGTNTIERQREVARRRRCAHCNDLPYDGPTLACPECGVTQAQRLAGR